MSIPGDIRVTDDLCATGRAAFEDGASGLENPWLGTGHLGRARFAGWLDAPAGRADGCQRSVRALPHPVADDRAEPF